MSTRAWRVQRHETKSLAWAVLAAKFDRRDEDALHLIQSHPDPALLALALADVAALEISSRTIPEPDEQWTQDGIPRVDKHPRLANEMRLYAAESMGTSIEQQLIPDEELDPDER
ncbi:MAG: hypothetical protein Q8M73_12080 [Actinomycetota bacterium]|nr:hypothetical protein [Actinomycetota bacterium]